MSGAKRTVVVGLMTYQRPDGRHRLAYAGDEVEVHPDFLERFDRINVLQGPEPAAAEPEPEPEPAKKAAPAKKTAPPRQSAHKTEE